jgi:cobalamin biosynthesis Mg chelatase CobN
MHQADTYTAIHGNTQHYLTLARTLYIRLHNRPVLEALKKMYTVPMTSELVHGVSRMLMSPPPPPSLPAPTSSTATTAATTTAGTAATGANAASTATAAAAATGAASTADVKEDNTVVGSESVASYLPHSVKLPQKLAKRGAPVPITVQLGPNFDAAAVLRQTILNPSQVLLCA